MASRGPGHVWVLSRYSCFLPQTKHMHVRLIVDSKLPVAVNRRVNGCLSVYISPVFEWQPVQDIPRLSP